MNIQQHILIATLVLLTPSAYALNKCVDANGKVTYSDRACSTVSPGAAASTLDTTRPASTPEPAGDSSCAGVEQLGLAAFRAMQVGTPVEAMFESVGGLNRAHPSVIQVINHSYSFRTLGDDISPWRVEELTRNRCNGGGFGTLPGQQQLQGDAERILARAETAAARNQDAIPATQREMSKTDQSCGRKRQCGEMRDCAEARFYLNQCGVKSLDRDDDGIPCETICGN